MSKTDTSSKAPTQAGILKAAAFVFFCGGAVSGTILFFLGASWKAQLIAGWLFFGSFLAWVVAVHNLKKKGYLEQLARDLTDEEGKELEASTNQSKNP